MTIHSLSRMWICALGVTLVSGGCNVLVGITDVPSTGDEGGTDASLTDGTNPDVMGDITVADVSSDATRDGDAGERADVADGADGADVGDAPESDVTSPDPCESNGGCSSEATCAPVDGGRTCTCNTGYSGDGLTCTPINACLTNNGGCDPNATCTSTGPDTRTCACNSGYMGDGMTCTGIAACATNNGGCAPTAKCTSTGPNMRTCMCNPGYSGDGMTCTPINSCNANNGGCDANATCTSTGPGTNTCQCKAGYTGSGMMCTAINPCSANNGGCSPFATCTYTGPGTNSCTCNAGYTGDGTTCTAVNPCNTNNGGCSPDGTCTYTGPNMNTCRCNTGYSGDGVNCTPVNPCATNNGGCSPNATCTYTGPGMNTCACNTPDYSGDGFTCVCASSAPSSRSCNDCGTQSRTCTNNTWSAWSNCQSAVAGVACCGYGGTCSTSQLETGPPQVQNSVKSVTCSSDGHWVFKEYCNVSCGLGGPPYLECGACSDGHTFSCLGDSNNPSCPCR